MVGWSETTVRAGDPAPIKLEVGKPVLKTKHHVMPVEFYRDIAVLAFPTPKNPEYRIERWTQKALYDHNAKGIDFIADQRTAPADAVIAADSVLDLTDRMDADGNLDWVPDSGEWTVMRFGYRSTGAVNRPATSKAKGLEIDKLSRAAVDLHWDKYINQLIANAEGREALTTICIDSFEVGMQNWTDDLPQEFNKRRGYELMPMLLCMTGRVIDDTETTERVLWDMRVTVAELMQENYFGYFTEKCHELGLLLQLEPYGSGPFDATATALIGDTVLTEFWQREADRNLWTWTAQIISSGGHLSGNPIAGAEAFTSMKADWTAYPGLLKKWGDRAFARGINRYYFHTFAHQPFHDSVQPGMTFGPFGGNFHRNNTWFPKSRDWMDYIARCQFLMQSGSYQADLL
ncbi:MAG: glycosyl hydrolase, partial [Opitutales bacterium]